MGAYEMKTESYERGVGPIHRVNLGGGLELWRHPATPCGTYLEAVDTDERELVTTRRRIPSDVHEDMKWADLVVDLYDLTPIATGDDRSEDGTGGRRTAIFDRADWNRARNAMIQLNGRYASLDGLQQLLAIHATGWTRTYGGPGRYYSHDAGVAYEGGLVRVVQAYGLDI